MSSEYLSFLFFITWDSVYVIETDHFCEEDEAGIALQTSRLCLLPIQISSLPCLIPSL